MPSNFTQSMVGIIEEAERRQLSVDSSEEWTVLIQDIRNKFATFYPESIDVESITDALISHFDENVVPVLHDEIRSAISELYTANVARELLDVSANRVAYELRRDLTQPIRQEVERNRAQITEKLRLELMDSIKQELKKELEPQVRRELRDEIVSQLNLGKQ